MLRFRQSSQRGQSLIIFALSATMIFGFVALVLDSGVAQVSHRDFQTAADLGVLAGTGALGTGPSAAMVAAQTYAWGNLGINPGAITCTGTQLSGAQCTVTSTSGYQVVVTTPYSSSACVSPCASGNAVAVDITHDNPTDIAGVLGVNKIQIVGHAAAYAKPGTKTIPYALVTRLLQLVGSGAVTVYGTSVIGECSHGGNGGFTGNSGVNGGLSTVAGVTYNIGRAETSGTHPDVYASAQALLMENPATQPNNKCSGTTNSAAASSWPGGQFQDNACTANSTGCSGVFNKLFGLNDGFTSLAAATTVFGSNCGSTGNKNSDTNTCSPIGQCNWQDPTLWNVSNNTVFATAPLTATWNPTSASNPLTGDTSTPTCSPAATYEGTFTHAQFPGLPQYPDPEAIANQLLTAAPFNETNTVPQSPACGNTLTAPNGLITPVVVTAIGPTYGCSLQTPYGEVFTNTNVGSKARIVFSPGYYVFDGPNASLSISGSQGAVTGGIECAGATTGLPIDGCLFLFRDGAFMSMSGSTQTFCAPPTSTGLKVATNPLDQSCTFKFTDDYASSIANPNDPYPSPSYMILSGATSAAIRPIPYVLSGVLGSSCLGVSGSFCMPAVYSNDGNNCMGGTGSAPKSSPPVNCAVTFSNSGSTLDVGGTIYAPNGVVSAGSNGAPASGQVIADTIKLQGGSGNNSGVAFNGALISPTLEGGILFE